MQTNWAGLVSEMELVPSYHPGVTCDGCGVGPITGSRFKCKQCNNFDFCERCFSTKRTHKHTFNRIAEPSSAAVFAGRPGRRRHRSSGLDSSTTSMVLSNGPQGKQIKLLIHFIKSLLLNYHLLQLLCKNIHLIFN